MLRVGTVALAIGLAALPALAHDDGEEHGYGFTLGGVNLTLGLEAGASWHSVQNAQHGIGSNSANGVRRGGRQWQEGFLKPSLEAEYDSEAAGEFYGLVSVIGTATRGAGEANPTSTTSRQPSYLALNDAVIGWRNGNLFGDVMSFDTIDLSFGNQDFTVGDGFLITNGTLDGSRRAANYLGPRNTFERTAILKLNADPVRADLFHLEGDVDQKRMLGGDAPATKLYGVNVEWFGSDETGNGRFEYEHRAWYVGATALKIYEADRNFSFAGGQGGRTNGSNRDGLAVYAARFGGAMVPGLDDFGLFGEYAVQRGDNAATGGSVRAKAWYLQPEYTVSSMPWAPKLSYRFAHFSGDGNTTDTTDRSWDPLYSDAGPRGGNTWTQGQIYSQYVGANSNLETHFVGLEVQPLPDELTVGLALFRHRFASAAQAGATSRHLMDEVNLYAEWKTPIAGVTLAPALGLGRPGEGQKQALGRADRNDRTIWLAQIVLGYEF